MNQAAPPRVGEVKPGDWFELLAPEAGLGFTYRDGSERGLYTLLETVGGGVAMCDFDRDGTLEVFVCGGGDLTTESPHALGRSGGLFRQAR